MQLVVFAYEHDITDPADSWPRPQQPLSGFGAVLRTGLIRRRGRVESPRTGRRLRILCSLMRQVADWRQRLAMVASLRSWLLRILARFVPY